MVSTSTTTFGTRLLRVVKKCLRSPVRILDGMLRVMQPRQDASVRHDQWLKYEKRLDRHLMRQIKKEGREERLLISVLMQVYAPDLGFLGQAIDSVRKQSYRNWELCIAEDGSPDPAVREYLERQSAADPRIRVVFHPDNRHISAASNSALILARGAIALLLNQDDTLSEHALYWVATMFEKNPSAGLLYSDEDKIDEEGARKYCFFKPDWSPHLLMQQCYTGHLLAFRRELALQAGGFREGYEGAQDYDLALRLSRMADVVHVPKILYHWRLHPQSTALNYQAKPYAHEAGRRALLDALRKQYGERLREVEDGDYPFTYVPRFRLDPQTKVSVIIPTRDKVELLESCLRSIRDRSTWPNMEIVVLDNGSQEPSTLSYLKALQERDPQTIVVPLDIPFNWSRLNNIGVQRATGEVLIFLNNDTEVITADWVERLAELATLPEVGVVGSLLLYEDGTIQHAGVVVGMGGWADHLYKGEPLDHGRPYPFISPAVSRNVLAVTGACLAISRDKFEALGGFDEDFIVCGSDVELGLRAHKRGFYNVICAQAQLYHHESKTRDAYVPQQDFRASQCKYEPYRTQAVDPYFNPNLSLKHTTPHLSLRLLRQRGAP